MENNMIVHEAMNETDLEPILALMPVHGGQELLLPEEIPIYLFMDDEDEEEDDIDEDENFDDMDDDFDDDFEDDDFEDDEDDFEDEEDDYDYEEDVDYDDFDE